jgi:hypothetical protein
MTLAIVAHEVSRSLKTRNTSGCFLLSHPSKTAKSGATSFVVISRTKRQGGPASPMRHQGILTGILANVCETVSGTGWPKIASLLLLRPISQRSPRTPVLDRSSAAVPRHRTVRFDDVIGRNTKVGRAPFNHPQHRRENTSYRGDFAAFVIPRRRQRVVMPK